MLTLAEVATELGVSRAHLKRLVERGDASAHIVNGELLFDSAQVEALRTSFAEGRAHLHYLFTHADEIRSAAIEELAQQM